MNKFTKISAATLFAIFLSACDKPAETAKTESPQPATQTAPAEVKPSEAPKAEAVDEQGVNDLKAITAWNQEQEKVLETAQAELQKKLESGDKAQIEEGMKAFGEKMAAVIQSLDALEIKSPLVSEFKAKTKEVLSLSGDLLAESAKALANPAGASAEAQTVIQEKAQKLLEKGAELQKLELDLQQKFGNK